MLWTPVLGFGSGSAQARTNRAMDINRKSRGIGVTEFKKAVQSIGEERGRHSFGGGKGIDLEDVEGRVNWRGEERPLIFGGGKGIDLEGVMADFNGQSTGEHRNCSLATIIEIESMDRYHDGMLSRSNPRSGFPVVLEWRCPLLILLGRLL
ncbi:hypothetical protein V2J09_007752 [Rumex salicifolius]